MQQRKIIIAGVGRSGTSFLFEEVAAALKTRGARRCFYEPYLWDPPKVNDQGQVACEPFDTRNLSPFGIYVHCASPLFLQQPHPIHEQMVQHVLDHRAHVIAKLIRGNGRLLPYLRRDPGVKVLGIVRDVLGTLNSAANHFSFFGEEFHPTDRPRFRQEVAAHFGDALKPAAPGEASERILWSANWWKYMTLALLQAQQAFPARVGIVDYESLRLDPEGAYRFIEQFLQLPLRRHRSQRRVGIVSSANYLGPTNLELLASYHRWLQTALAAGPQLFLRPDSYTSLGFAQQRARYTEQRTGVVLQYPLYRTVVGWRYAMAKTEPPASNPAPPAVAAPKRPPAHPRSAATTAPPKAAAYTPQPPAVTVVIPAWNAQATLERAVASVWSQQGVQAEVVIVDDASADGTAALAERLLRQGPGRLVRNQRQLGPGLSRHKGIQAAQHPLITTLDADDRFLPLKLAAERDALANDPRAVAFSDISYVRNDRETRWDCRDSANLTPMRLLERIAGRRGRIPRDMLFHRALYARTRGFDAMLPMYEDWAFKIDLAAVAARWVHSGNLGVQYAHGHGGQSRGGAGRHRFFLHAAFLRHADLLATQFGGAAIGLLSEAVAPFGTPDELAAGFARLRARARFSGHLLADLRQLRLHIHRQVFVGGHIPYDQCLAGAYAGVAQDAAQPRQARPGPTQP